MSEEIIDVPSEEVVETTPIETVIRGLEKWADTGRIVHATMVAVEHMFKTKTTLEFLEWVQDVIDEGEDVFGPIRTKMQKTL